MGSKEEWEELEQWKEQKNKKEKAELGASFEEFGDTRVKWIDRLTKFLKRLGVSYKIFAIIVFLIAAVAIGLFLIFKYIEIKNEVDIDFEGTIKSMYQIDIKILSKDTDKKGNGFYTIKDKDNDVTFHVIKNYGKMTEDYFACVLKNKFEKWESKSKDNFIVDEKVENKMQKYNIYIEIKNEDELVDSTNKIIEFYEFCQFKYFAASNVYIKYKDSRIYPYTSYFTTREDAINNAKESFDKINKLK